MSRLFLSPGEIGPPFSGGKRYDFEYEYSFEGKRYTSSRFSIKHTFQADHEPVKRFKKGDKITVYVNPKNPKQVYIELENPGFTVYLFTIGSILVFYVSYVVCFDKKNSDNKKFGFTLS